MKALRALCIVLACLVMQACGMTGVDQRITHDGAMNTVMKQNVNWRVYNIDDLKDTGIEAEYSFHYIKDKFNGSKLILNDTWLDCTYRISISTGNMDGPSCRSETRRPPEISSTYVNQKIGTSTKYNDMEVSDGRHYLSFVFNDEGKGVSPVTQTIYPDRSVFYFEDEFTKCRYEVTIGMKSGKSTVFVERPSYYVPSKYRAN